MAFPSVSRPFLAIQSVSCSRSRLLFPYLRPLILSSRFSSLDERFDTLNNECRIKNQCVIDECYVLDELSNLLPASRSTSMTTLHKRENSKKQIEISREADGFLLAEEKLRGVFVQKLRGKTAIEQALTDVGVDLSVVVVGKVLNRGNLDEKKMVMFFNWAIKQPMIPKDIDTYHVILKALGRRKFLNCMVEVLHQLRVEGVNPNLETLEIVMDSLIRARQVSKAIRMFQKLDEIGLDCDTESLNVLLQCLCRRSHVGAANSLLHSMKGKIPYNSTTYNIVMNGWSKFGRVSEIERMLEAMVGDGIDPDGSTFSHLIEGLGRAGQIDDAVRIFESVKEKNGWMPGSSAYNAMISNYIAVGDLEECLKYYNSMLSSTCEPNIDTYTKLIGSFLKVRRVADALEMFDEMLEKGIVPSTGTVTSFIEPLCSYGPPHAAMMLYKKAKRVGCRISLSAYKLLLMRLSRFGKCGMLLNMWNEMQEFGYSSDVEVYEYIINGLCNIGQLENAVLVMEECLKKGFCPSRLICSKLNNKLLALNRVEIAYKLFLKLKDARLKENARRYWRAKGWHF